MKRMLQAAEHSLLTLECPQLQRFDGGAPASVNGPQIAPRVRLEAFPQSINSMQAVDNFMKILLFDIVIGAPSLIVMSGTSQDVRASP